MSDTIWLASFDIGKKNFAFCIEETDRSELLSLSQNNLPLGQRYNKNGTPTPKMKTMLDSICGNGRLVLFKNNDLTENCAVGSYLDPESYHNMTDVLDQYREQWDKCEAFVIEQQMAFRGKQNTMALKLGQHCYSYFAFTYGRHKSIIEFPAYHKTCVLGAEKVKGKKTKKGVQRWKTLGDRERKKWSVEKALAILESRGEEDRMNEIKTKRKKDDLADVVTMLNAFKYLCFVDQSV
jgi:hypothetical protein